MLPLEVFAELSQIVDAATAGTRRYATLVGVTLKVLPPEVARNPARSTEPQCTGRRKCSNAQFAMCLPCERASSSADLK